MFNENIYQILCITDVKEQAVKLKSVYDKRLDRIRKTKAFIKTNECIKSEIDKSHSKRKEYVFGPYFLGLQKERYNTAKKNIVDGKNRLKSYESDPTTKWLKSLIKLSKATTKSEKNKIFKLFVDDIPAIKTAVEKSDQLLTERRRILGRVPLEELVPIDEKVRNYQAYIHDEIMNFFKQMYEPKKRGNTKN